MPRPLTWPSTAAAISSAVASSLSMTVIVSVRWPSDTSSLRTADAAASTSCPRSTAVPSRSSAGRLVQASHRIERRPLRARFQRSARHPGSRRCSELSNGIQRQQARYSIPGHPGRPAGSDRCAPETRGPTPPAVMPAERRRDPRDQVAVGQHVVDRRAPLHGRHRMMAVRDAGVQVGQRLVGVQQFHARHPHWRSALAKLSTSCRNWRWNSR